MIDDAAAVFLDTEHFAESLTFYPVGGSSRSIDAIVVEQGQQREDTNSHLTESRTVSVTARVHATAGLTYAELKLTAYLRRSTDASDVRWDFQEIVADQSDAAMVTARFKLTLMRHQGQRRPATL